MSLPTRIMHCKCESEYQDSKYGRGKRLQNKTGGKTKSNDYRCTICGTTNTPA